MLPLPWNQKIQKVSVDCSHCVPFSSFLSLHLFPRLLLLWRSPLHLYLPLAVSPQFPHPFFNLLYVLSQNLRRNQRSRRKRLRLEKLVLVYSPFLFFFVTPPLFLFLKKKKRLNLFFLSLFFASVDIGVKDSEPAIPKGIVRSVQITDLQSKQKAASFPVSAGGDTVMGGRFGSGCPRS